ncbi:MAG: FAD-dependent oxidoreductase [Deltaproteobacteria bacterium]|nr:MAG: FAD-dependent oxidoreductase [Deltaproteobacteria bacterium]
MDIAVIGAGPIGIEAALAASDRGHDVTLFEAGDAPAHTMASWQHLPLYTNWRQSTTRRGRDRAGLDVDLLAYPTAEALIERYLRPLAAHLTIHLQTRVVGIARQNSCKEQDLQSNRRSSDPFRLLLHVTTGDAATQADAVLDCSGVWNQPKPVGRGGLPTPGELAAVAAGRLRHGPQPTDTLRDRRVLLVGDGPDAAMMLRDLLEGPNHPEVLWISRHPRGPSFDGPLDDPLPARAALRDFAKSAVTRVDHRPGAQIDALRPVGRTVEVHLASGEVLEVDRVFGCTGYHPDLSLYRELHVASCPRTERPGRAEPTAPFTSEHRFFVLGRKSAGRREDFVLAQGHAQIQAVLDSL